jgi:hypothetical protein
MVPHILNDLGPPIAVNVAGFKICSIISQKIFRFNIKVDLKIVDCEDVRWMELTQDYVR